MYIYFNSPCVLWRDFLLDEKRRQIANDVTAYIMAVEFDTLGDMDAVRKKLSIKGGDDESIIKNGNSLIERCKREAMFSVKRDVFWDFVDNYHSYEENVALLAYLALKSIIGNNEYRKTNAKLWLSRMDGYTKPIDTKLLSDPIRKWATPYKVRYLKCLLWKYYNVTFYSLSVRGFYASIKMDFQELVKAIKNDGNNKCKNLMDEFKANQGSVMPNKPF